MEIDFKDEKLRRLCEQQQEAVRRLGRDSARKLRARLADCQAAPSVADLPPTGHPHPLERDRKGQFSIRLHGGHRLVFCPGRKPIPTHDDGTINWAQVTEITIVYIGDYHD